MTEIYVVRHGIAVAREENAPDEFRPLTEKGRRRFRKTARAFARLGRKLDAILTSPLVRAVQTAEILAGEIKHGEVAVLGQLDPKFGVGSLLEALGARADGAKAVAVVGHEPQLSALVAALAGVPAQELDLKKGGIVRLDIGDLSQPGSAEARWSLKPRSKTVDKGLPLAEAEAAAGEEKAEEAAAPKQKEGRSGKRRSRRARRRAAPVRDTGEDASGASNAGSAANVETESGDGEKASGGSREERLDDARGPSTVGPGGSDSPREPA
jgi:phosphohistidine phosphatase